MIYKLTSKDGYYYYGSTFKSSVEKRLIEHKSFCKTFEQSNNKNSKLYNHFKNIGWDDCVIECVEQINIDDKTILRTIESKYIKNAVNDEKCLNMDIPKHTSKEYYRDNKETLLEKSKIKRQANLELYRQRARDQRIKHAEKLKAKVLCYCDVIYTRHHATDHRKTKRHNDFVNKQIARYKKAKEKFENIVLKMQRYL